MKRKNHDNKGYLVLLCKIGGRIRIGDDTVLTLLETRRTRYDRKAVFRLETPAEGESPGQGR